MGIAKTIGGKSLTNRIEELRVPPPVLNLAMLYAAGKLIITVRIVLIVDTIKLLVNAFVNA